MDDNYLLGRSIQTVAKGAGINVVGVGVRAGMAYTHGIIVARLVGASAYGIYSIGLSLHMIFLLAGQLGLKQAIVRYVAEYRTRNRADKVKAILLRSLQLSIGITLLLALVELLAADYISTLYASERLAAVVRLFALSLPVAASAELLSAFTQAFRTMRFKFLVQDLLRPLLELVFAISLVLLVGLSVTGLALAYLLASLIGLVLLWRFSNQLAGLGKTQTVLNIAIMPVVIFAAPVLITDLLQVAMVRMSVLLVGALRDSVSAGAFNAASQTAAFSMMFLTSFGLIIAPLASSLYHSQQHEQLGQLFRITTRWMLTLSLPIFALSGYLAAPILSLFGKEFTIAAPAMVLLIVGQFVNVSVGAGGVVINMAGHTYLNMINSTLAFIGTLVLSLWLIPRHGLIGAGIALGSMIAFLNILQVIEVRLLLRIYPYSKSYLKSILSGMVGGLLGFGAHNLFVPCGLVAQNIATTTFFLGGYVAILLLLKIDPEERLLWRSLQARLGRK